MLKSKSDLTLRRGDRRKKGKRKEIARRLGGKESRRKTRRKTPSPFAGILLIHGILVSWVPYPPGLFSAPSARPCCLYRQEKRFSRRAAEAQRKTLTKESRKPRIQENDLSSVFGFSPCLLTSWWCFTS